MSKPLLHRVKTDWTYERCYRIHGYDHLVVEANFSDPDFERPKLENWLIRDTRFTTSLDKWARWLVLVVPRLEDARSWIRAGGPALWDPERKKTDRNWRPIPDGWQAGEARGEVPGRTDPGARPGRRMAGGGRGLLRSEGRREDCRRDAEPGDPPHRDFRPSDVTGKKYAVCPGYVTSANDGQRHFIGFGALTWLYGVKPSECLHVTSEMQSRRLPPYVEELIWLHPQRDARRYNEMREELARGDDAFKLEPGEA